MGTGTGTEQSRFWDEERQPTDCTDESMQMKERSRSEEWALGGGRDRGLLGKRRRRRRRRGEEGRWVRERFHLKRKAAWTWVMLVAEGQYYYYAFSQPAFPRPIMQLFSTALLQANI